MTTYSHSRISTFQQCKYKYKLQYIDKIKVDVPTTIEAFMGDMVHQALEKLYSDLKFQKLLSLNELIEFYDALWEENWDNKILIVKKQYSPENYQKMGEKYIRDYYNRYNPFDQLTILGLETQDVMLLPDGNNYHVRIDKLASKGKTYYVCDYKTNSSMKDQEEADNDRQLAMYSIWVKDRFKDAEKVVLLWHMLAFDKDVESSRTDAELQKLQTETVNIIADIEKEESFPQKVSNLCSYCVYKNLCPSFTHKIEIQTKKDDLSEDDGVKLIDELSSLEKVKKEVEEKIETTKERLIKFSIQKNASIIYGTDKKASIKEYLKVVYPEDKTQFIELIKKKGLYEDFSSINYLKLSSKILKNEVDKGIVELIKKERNYLIKLSKLK